MNLEEIANEARKEKDSFMKTNSNSPLTPQQKKSFMGLNYFLYDAKYRIEGPIEEFKQKKIVKIGTNTGEMQKYRLFGKFSFEVNRRQLSLQIYQSLDKTSSFIPFSDGTSSNETYGAGRYVELENVGPNLWVLDFNFAYNPYCAYNDRWTCPLVPPINRLDIRIEAGEKAFENK